MLEEKNPINPDDYPKRHPRGLVDVEEVCGENGVTTYNEVLIMPAGRRPGVFLNGIEKRHERVVFGLIPKNDPWAKKRMGAEKD